MQSRAVLFMVYDEVAEQAVINALAGTEDESVAYPLPTKNSMPSQETTPKRRRVPR